MRKTSIFIAFLIVSMGLVFSAPFCDAAEAKKKTRRPTPPITAPRTDTSTRLALIIGNGAYETGPLKNPVNDATDMAAALKDLGFTVILEKNADLRTMKKALEDFGNRLKRGGVGLFYYAGHGVQVQNTNFLIPVQAQVKAESDVEFEALHAGRILAKMADANNGLNIVILDACRDNPFARQFRSASSGLAGISKAPLGTFIAYSTGPGEVAGDGEARNSPFTGALLETIKQPGLTIEQVFKGVRQKISSETKGQQIPWELSSLQGEFYFKPAIRPETPKKEKQTAALGVQGQAEDSQYEKEQKSIAEERRRLEAEKAQLEKDRKRIEQKQRLEEERQKLAEEKKRLEEEKEALAARKARKEEVKTAMALRPQAPSSPSTYTDSLTGMEFVLIPAGSFTMGSPDNESGRDSDEGPQHPVTISRPFYLGKYEVTVGQFRKFVQDTGYKTEAETRGGAFIWADGKWGKKEGTYWDNPGFSQTERHPVTCVSWNDAQAFIQWINRETGRSYRLPTEAEWEYAARAGTTTSRFWGDDPNKACQYANVADRTKSPDGKYHWDNKHECTDGYWFTAPAGSFNPNAFGLYDILGNVWEWCQDWKGGYQSGSLTNPTGPSSGSDRVIRGGSWFSVPRGVRAASRDGGTPGGRDGDLGFRLAGPK